MGVGLPNLGPSLASPTHSPCLQPPSLRVTLRTGRHVVVTCPAAVIAEERVSLSHAGGCGAQRVLNQRRGHMSSAWGKNAWSNSALPWGHRPANICLVPDSHTRETHPAILGTRVRMQGHSRLSWAGSTELGRNWCRQCLETWREEATGFQSASIWKARPDSERVLCKTSGWTRIQRMWEPLND